MRTERREGEPDPRLVTTRGDLAKALAALRLAVGNPSMDTLITRARHLSTEQSPLNLARSTGYDAQQGTKMPSRETVLAFVTSCRNQQLQEEDETLWTSAWRRAAEHDLEQKRRRTKDAFRGGSPSQEENPLAGHAEGVVRRLLNVVDPGDALQRLMDMSPLVLRMLADETNVEATAALLVAADDAASVAGLLLLMDITSASRVLSHVDSASAASWLDQMPRHQAGLRMLLMETDAMTAATLLMGQKKASQIERALDFDIAVEEAAAAANDLAAEQRTPKEGADLLLSLDLPTAVKLLMTLPAAEAASWLKHLPDVEAGARLLVLLEWEPQSPVQSALGNDAAVRMLMAFTRSLGIEIDDLDGDPS
ncbi:hypothetical protein [Streptomyces melanogenes]|uniref:hypothetical protein n=1 Tax=Streptomyces melanogenes TaxID=67326 RepID=UPI0037899CB5